MKTQLLFRTIYLNKKYLMSYQKQAKGVESPSHWSKANIILIKTFLDSAIFL